MFNIDRVRAKPGVLTILASLLVLGLLVAGCNDDEISKLPEAQVAPLVVRKASGGSKDLTGTRWFESCYDQGSPPPYFQAFMTMGTSAKRTEITYADSICTSQIGSVSFNFHVTADGTMPNVTWVDNGGFATTPPPGHNTSYSVTMVTISGHDGSSPFLFKTLLFYDNLVSPAALIFGDDNTGQSPLVNGYPTTMFIGGAIQQ